MAPLAVVPIAVPADGTVYQLMVLPVEVAFRFEEPPGHTLEGVAVTGVGGAGNGIILLTVALPWVPQQPCDERDLK